MLSTNQRKRVLSTLNLKVSEIFFSIQGEGPLVGYPTFFIRLFGCNLSCRWCDTTYAREGNNYRILSVQEILDCWKIDYSSIPFITITGGEPLLQSEVYVLIRGFMEQGCTVLIETNGSLDLKDIPEEVIKVVDIKTPSSGMERYNLYTNLRYLKLKDAVKFVIKDKTDLQFALYTIKTWNLLSKTQVFFSPVYAELSPTILAQWILDLRLPIRFQLQLHKILNLK